MSHNIINQEVDIMLLSQQSIYLEKKFSYITKDPEYKGLSVIKRHSYTNTYDHSIRVAVAASLIAKWLHADSVSASRAALLHDFCLVDYNKKNDHPGLYCFYHPKEAAENAERFNLSRTERKAIETHMFPLGKIPTSRIGWSITIADKVVAIYEKFYGISSAKKLIMTSENEA